MPFSRRALLACFLPMICLTGCADSILLLPPKSAHVSANARELAIPFRDGILQIWTQRSNPCSGEQPRAFVLQFVGNASRAEYAIEPAALRWRPFNAEVWAVNYPGYGASSGRATLRSIAPAALVAYDALANVAAGRPIFVVGRSLGTTAALHVAAHRRVAGVVLHSPTPLRPVILGDFGWWNLWLAAGPIALQVPSDLDCLANARRATAHAVFLITERDTLVRPARQRQVVAAYAGRKQVISLPSADHNVSATAEEELAIQSAIAGLTTLAASVRN
jgi:uncharacterized protein